MTSPDQVLESYRNNIFHWHHILAGEIVGPSGKSWQDVAVSLSHDLRRYADYLDNCAGGHVSGPIVFPSWDSE